ncbi:MAG TPA: VWA domain-containing protein [Terriglobales bacterium]|nr:VWA domain-containing protein [Terriglobales bacterium]
MLTFLQLRKRFQKAHALGLAFTLLTGALFSQQTSEYTFRAKTELVLVNVTVRDRNGNPVHDLKRDDFSILEDNKPQQVSSFDIENSDAAVSTATLESKPLANLPAKSQAAPALIDSSTLKDRRLIVLFFDLSSMQPEEIDRAVTAAQNYVDKQMAPADLIAVLSLDNTLTVNQDFTSDRDTLKKTLRAFNLGAGQGYEEGATGATEGTADTGASFTVDDTEYNIFNTDRRLEALRSIADRLARIDQKKSLIYFSSGMDRTGIENESELRAATNAAVRANLSIYTMDMRGLQAMVPGGEAQSASLRGTSPYSGKSTLNQYDSNFINQETLVTLAGDTGGRAFLDSNDFGRVFSRVQQDTSYYYLLGYRSTNTARDGRFRRITVRINRPGLKLEFRHGYYAPADFQHANREDREQQLEQELASDLPSTDLQVYLSAAYFRMSDNGFYVPVSLVVPGSQIPFMQKNDQDRATLDIVGAVFDPNKRPVNQVRDTVKLALNTSQLVQHKNVQYDTSFVLPSGQYHLKFVLRENQTGQIGSFETDLTIPDLKSVPLKLSSIVLASQIQPAARKRSDNPLVRDGSELIPSVTHVFSSGQHLYFYYEVYDPVRGAAPAKAAGKQSAPESSGIRLLTNVVFFRGNVKAYETPLVETQELNSPDRKAAIFQLDVPLTQLKAGFYTCQVNVIDDAAGQFRFPRLALLVRDDRAISQTAQ